MSPLPPDPPRGDNPLLPSDWQNLAPLIDAVLDAPPEHRAALILELSAGDPARQRALQHLVAECERDTPLLDRVAAERFDGLAQEAPDSLLPELLGDRYRVGRELGRGGTARVYLARDLKHERDVAIKVIRPELAASLGRDRFLREIGIAARLRHPNIMPLYDSGDADGVLYFVMPYEQGLSLRARLERDGGLPLADAVSILRDVARALAYAHQHGVVHRDVKPDNVLLSGDAAVVTDFGIAKAFSAALTEAGGNTITQAGSVIGTPAYMAPEQGMGDPATDHRADLYSFGCLAYEALTGKPPFTGSTTFQIIAAQMGTPAKPITQSRADVPAAIAELIARCLEKDPAGRPQSASELLDVLGSVATMERVPIPRRRVSARVAALMAAIAILLATAGYFITRGGTPVTVAVLPLLSVGGDSNQAFLAAGFSDDIATALNKVPWLKVMSQGGAGNYRGQGDLDLKQTGKVLGASYLVTGSVRSLDGQFSVQLVSSEDGSTLWAEGFDRPAQLEALRDEIVTNIGDSLRLKAGGSWPVQVAGAPGKHRSVDAAYRLYIMGKDQLNRRKQSVEEPIALFKEAIALDTLLAEAYSDLSLALAISPYFGPVSTDSVSAETTAMARQALKLNPRLAEPHVALSFVLRHRFQWDSAESELKAALELDGHNVEALLQYGQQLRIQDRLTESMRQLQAAREGDPASAVVASHLSYGWYLTGQMDSALAESARALRIDSENLQALQMGAEVQMAAGRNQKARELVQRIKRRNHGVTLYVLARTGDRDTVLERLKTLVGKNAYNTRAMAMLGLGDTAQALDAPERARTAGESWGFAQSGRMFAGVRGSARFQALLHRVGLAP